MCLCMMLIEYLWRTSSLKAFLYEVYLTEQEGRIRYFTIPSHRARLGRPFCPQRFHSLSFFFSCIFFLPQLLFCHRFIIYLRELELGFTFHIYFQLLQTFYWMNYTTENYQINIMWGDHLWSLILLSWAEKSLLSMTNCIAGKW